MPFGLIVAALVKLSDRGPVFYSQIRVGQFGKPFRIWKFRSMVVNADKQGAPLTRGEDPRITWLGLFLRKLKLDELPQLWNVLVGEMSLVGPRPEVPRYVEFYTAEQREILKLKPGITDLATLSFRNEEAILKGATNVEAFYLRYCLPKKIQLNLEYARRATLSRDVWIILQTLCPYWIAVLAVYSLTLAVAFWLTCLFQADFRVSGPDVAAFERWLPWVVLPQLMLLFWKGQLRGLLSYFSIPELRRTVSALALALVLQLGLNCFARGGFKIASSLLLMDFVFAFASLCAVRMALRLSRERSSRSGLDARDRLWRVAVIGTGEQATNLALDLERRRRSGLRLVAFFDDDPRSWHKRPHDVPVVGMPECLQNGEWRHKLDEVVVAMKDCGPDRLGEIREMLGKLPFKVTLASGWPAVTCSEIGADSPKGEFQTHQEL